MSDTALALPLKEVEQTNKQMMKLQDKASSLTLKSPEDVQVAADLLETIKAAEKTITGRKEEITRPLMRSLASVRDLFKPIELTLENAKKVTKAKVIAYQTVEAERIQKEKDKIEAKVQKGTLRVSTAIDKLEALKPVATTGSMKTRTITKVRVMDETMIPIEYMLPNMPKITEAVLRQGIEIPGVEKYSEKIIAV